jgi:uncharacterized phage protein (TIGR02216 family)
MMSEAFPWARIMHLGLGILRLPPEQFWRSTLRELATALPPSMHGLDRTMLEQLMKDHPDND